MPPKDATAAAEGAAPMTGSATPPAASTAATSSRAPATRAQDKGSTFLFIGSKLVAFAVVPLCIAPLYWIYSNTGGNKSDEIPFQPIATNWDPHNLKTSPTFIDKFGPNSLEGFMKRAEENVKKGYKSEEGVSMPFLHMVRPVKLDGSDVPIGLTGTEIDYDGDICHQFGVADKKIKVTPNFTAVAQMVRQLNGGVRVYTRKSKQGKGEDQFCYRIRKFRVPAVNRTLSLISTHLRLFVIDDFIAENDVDPLIDACEGKFNQENVHTLHAGAAECRPPKGGQWQGLKERALHLARNVFGSSARYEPEDPLVTRYSQQALTPHNDDQCNPDAAIRRFSIWTSMSGRGLDRADPGKIEFPFIHFQVQPKPGRAIMWENFGQDGRCRPYMMHQAHPPIETAGKPNYLLNIWVREPELPSKLSRWLQQK